MPIAGDSLVRHACIVLLAVCLAVSVAAGGCSSPRKRVSVLPENYEKAGYLCVTGVHLPTGKVVFDCGPEAVVAVLNYFGDDVTVEQVAIKILSPDVLGTASVSLPPYIRGRGFEKKLAKGDLDLLRRNVKNGLPTIVMVNVRPLQDSLGALFTASEVNHFFVVTGYNDRTREVVCEGYDDSKCLIEYDAFNIAWEKCGFFALTVFPKKPAEPAPK
jgi:predicted double-glycine peptidase